MDGVAYLIYKTSQQDAIGQHIPTKGKREIFVSEGSLTRSEFFKAGQNGMAPAIMLVTAAVNYLGETEIEYKDAQYEIYRTYHEKDSDEIELYLHRKAGTQKGGGQCL